MIGIIFLSSLWSVYCFVNCLVLSHKYFFSNDYSFKQEHLKWILRIFFACIGYTFRFVAPIVTIYKSLVGSWYLDIDQYIECFELTLVPPVILPILCEIMVLQTLK